MTLKLYACSACLARGQSGRPIEDPCVAIVPGGGRRPAGCLYPDQNQDAPEWREADLRALACRGGGL